MPNEGSKTSLTFTEACEYLALSPDEMVTLREARMVACLRERGRQIYPREALGITQRFRRVAANYNWGLETLAWYADLCFFNAIGRTLLLPAEDVSPQLTTTLPSTWLERPHLDTILGDFEGVLNGSDQDFNSHLRSIVYLATGEGQHWSDLASLEHSPLYPIIAYLEQQGIPIVGQSSTVIRDAGTHILALMMTFTHVAPAMSKELTEIISSGQSRFSTASSSMDTVDPSDRQTILDDGSLVAVDQLYVARASEIHSQPEKWEVQNDRLSGQQKTVQLVVNLPLNGEQAIIDNILDLIRPYVGPFGARVVHLLYEIANDAPYWRTPQITVDTNELLDRLGLKRDANGYHRSKNRERLRDVLNVAHYLEIVGEYSEWVQGRQETVALRRTVLSLTGARYSSEDRQGISTGELFERGLPRTMQIRLNFYDSVRRPDGRLGNKYVLFPRLAAPQSLPKANRTATADALKAYFLLRYRQAQMRSRTLVVTRQDAVTQANIHNKNASMATTTLRKALDRLITEGLLESYSADIPLQEDESFEVVLSERATL
jgi:hypothetical protein